MVSSIEDALRMAYSDRGLELPTWKTSNVVSAKPKPKPKIKSNAPRHQHTQSFRKSKSSRSTTQSVNSVLSPKMRQELVDVPIIKPSTPMTTRPVLQPMLDDYPLNISPEARLAFIDSEQKNIRLLSNDFFQGHATQCHGAISDERELVLGLDFGTSSMKVVIGDSALGIAFAVPFTADNGIKRYLLPSRIYENDGVFSLQQGAQDYRDLKLSLIANPTNLTLQKPVIAFLAFVIRYARTWLFCEHADKYCNTLIFWRLKIGLPVAHHLDQSLSELFIQIGRTAWFVASTLGKITTTVIDAAREHCNVPTNEDVEVIPEIAAQIYGFVNSNQFDKRALNLYLMVDVGAGTVDSSLFQVKPAKAGRWNFEFFTSVVEPLGVMNLHRYRVNWWQTALQKSGDTGNLLLFLEKLKFHTDREIAIPDYCSDYFEGVNVELTNNKKTPDSLFFEKVCEQVIGKTYWKAWKSQLLTQAELRGIPVFYCGGGIRMPFYRNLRDQLKSNSNYSWISAIPRRIECPKRLNAPGLQREDFDRLSVAYGLSFLEVGKIIKAIPQPKQIDFSENNWREYYIDKDQC